MDLEFIMFMIYYKYIINMSNFICQKCGKKFNKKSQYICNNNVQYDLHDLLYFKKLN